MSQPYKSGRQQNLNLGISSVTENKTVLQTIGKVGIGTTNAQNHSLFVVGSTNITGDINVGGASTFVGLATFNDSVHIRNQLFVGGVNITGGATVGTDIVTRNLKATGISTFVGITTVESTLFTNQLSVSGFSTFQSTLVGTQANFSGIVTANTFVGQINAGVGTITTLNSTSANITNINSSGISTLGVTSTTNLTAQNLNVTGVGTIKTFVVPSGGEFDVYDTTAVFHNNVRIDGNLSIGGTATVITTQDLRVFDRDIILGIATDAFGNDITTDTSANHGGIAIASTEGSPLVDLSLVGFSSIPATYKQLMWVAKNSYGVGTTDAWMFNYAVGIGSTLVPNGVRFAVKGIQFTDTTISAPNLNLSSNLNVAGITTLAANGGITTTGGDLFVGGDLYIKDDLFFDEFTARNANITGLTTVGVVSATSVNATGIITASSFRPSSGFYQSANGTNAFFVYNGTGNVAFQGTIGVGQINSAQGYQTITLSSDSIPTVTFVDNGRFAGVVTARQFVGDVNSGVATITNGLITNASGSTLNYTGISTLGVTGVTNLTAQQLNVSGLSTFAGITTVTGQTLFTKQLDVSGIATINKLDVNQISPDGLNFGGAQYLLRANGDGTWGWADVPGIFSVNNILNGFNVSDEGLIVGTAGSITQLDFRGSNIIASADLQPNGIATIRVSDNPDFSTLNVTGLSTFAGITTVTGSTLFAKQLNVSGISTFVGVSTFVNDLFVGGSLFIKNDLVFDEATLRNLNVTGLSTIRTLDALSANVTGVVTARQFVGDVNSGVATITNGLITNASGATLNYAGLSTIRDISASGINVSGVVTARQFVGDISAGFGTFSTISATQTNITNVSVSGVVTARQFIGDVQAGVATITQGNIVNVSGATLNYTGLSTIRDISASGINVSGVVTARQFVGDVNAGFGTFSTISATQINLTNINITGVATARQFIGDVISGVATITQGNITNASGSTLNYVGLSTIRDISASGINISGVVTSRQFVGDISAGVSTITQGNITNASGSTLNYTGISTIADITSSGIRVSGVVTARQFVGDISAGVATITQGNVTSSSGTNLNYTGINTLGSITALQETVTGVVTARQFVGDVNAGVATITTLLGTNATFSGNVSIGGTLTYEDVTNVDSIGVITARSDVRVGGNLSVVGITTLASAGGITTTGGDLYIGDDIFFKGNLYQNGQLFAAGIGIGSTSRNPGSGVVNQRIGVGFTDINIVGTGISVTGYGTTVVIDFGNIAAGSGGGGGALSISTSTTSVAQDVTFVGGASTSIIGIATVTDRFVYVPSTGRVGIGTSAPAYKLDVVGDINSSTSVKIKGVDVLEEAVRLAIAFG